MKVNYEIERFCGFCGVKRDIAPICPKCKHRMRTKPFQKRATNLNYRSFEGY